MDLPKMISNTKLQMRKGVLEFCILNIISAGEVYPSDIITELKRSEMILKEGTLYPLLTRLKNAGLLEYVWRESKSGPPRKYYRLTPIGIEFRRGLQSAWEQLQQTVQLSESIAVDNTNPPASDQTIPSTPSTSSSHE